MYLYIQNVTRQIPAAKEVVPDIGPGFLYTQYKIYNKISLLDKCWWHIPFQDLVFCCLHGLFSNLQEKKRYT